MSTIDASVPTAARVSHAIGEALDQLCVNTIRTLAMDAVQQANSGHPGTPMALAPVVYCLWQRVLRFDPEHPIWPNRDRFVLSVGHASTLLYAMLHLAGVKAVNSRYETLGHPSVTLDDLKRFRQLEIPHCVADADAAIELLRQHHSKWLGNRERRATSVNPLVTANEEIVEAR